VNTTYKNLVGEKSWNKTSDKDAKIMALTTSLNEQKKKWSDFASKMNSSGVTPGKRGQDNEKSHKLRKNNSVLPAWRTTFKGKNITGEDGVSYDWCKEHVREGKYNGIYMPAPHEHAAWKKKKEEGAKKREERKNGSAKQSSPAASSSKTSHSSKMTIYKNLQTALVSKLGIFDKDSESMATEILGKE